MERLEGASTASVDEGRSFEAVYDAYAPAVARFAWSLSPTSSAAQDLLQETFLTAWDKRRSIPDLMPVMFEGREGYLRYKDQMRVPITLGEIRHERRERRRLGLDAHGKQYAFVYAADGETILGKMRID